MIQIDIESINYRDPISGKDCKHHILIAKSAIRNLLLSHVNLFIKEKGASSEATSRRYAYLLYMFYRYLSTEDEFKKIDISLYHVVVSNKTIRRWQVSRQIERAKAQKDKPSSETIFDDAKLLLNFFKWLNDQGYATSVVVNTKTWIANFKSNRLLNYISRKAKVTIDSKNIEVLDKHRRQYSPKSLITNDEIKILLSSYCDPVYTSLFKFSLATAMRPMELCKFPYLGNGTNKHVMPYSQMSNKNSAIIDYLVMGGKGNKDRTIKINIADLRILEEQYINVYYHERASKYKKRFGEKCPPSILFLNNNGLPVTATKISSRTNYAKELIIARNIGFREGISFYDARHWWPTMFLINFFKDKLLTSSADALYAAAAQVLMNQMGHNDIDTTYKYYVDMARLVLIAHQGLIHELVSEPKETVDEFIARLDSGSIIPAN